MGAWGYYDDENDRCCDEWFSLLESLAKASNWNSTEPEKYEEKFVESFEDSRFRNLVVKLTKKKTENWSGICLMMLKLLCDKPVQIQPLYGMPPASDIEITVPDSFPSELCDSAILSIECNIEDIDNDGWKSVDERLSALNHELYIFSKGRLGSKTPRVKNAFEELLKGG